ncbi:MAG: hypothetical protein U0787_21925 [Polyangia bacterium]
MMRLRLRQTGCAATKSATPAAGHHRRNFPGWYSGRTSHVHFIVTANGKTYVTSQLLFDETLTTAVYTKHQSYSARGNKDTTNAKDNVVNMGLPVASSIMSFSQQNDGALVCTKAITIA